MQELRTIVKVELIRPLTIAKTRDTMPARIGIPQRIIEDIAVAVKGLWVGGCLGDTVRRNEPPEARIVITGIIVSYLRFTAM